jgi:hypothetical protein
MDTPEQIRPLQKYNRLVIVSFVLGAMTILFPIISVVYLIVANGGPGYFQSLFCGIPIAFASIITGIVSLAQKRERQKGGWMAAWGIVFGNLFFVVACILVFILLAPYLSGTAH